MDFLKGEDIDGILGFSQGAAMVTVLLAELAEKQQKQPFAFACLFSGFIPSQKQMREKVLKAGTMFDDSVTSVNTASTTATSQLNLFHSYAKEDIVIPSSKSIIPAKSILGIKKVRLLIGNGNYVRFSTKEVAVPFPYSKVRIY